jgi:hypothetical protein
MVSQAGARFRIIRPEFVFLLGVLTIMAALCLPSVHVISEPSARSARRTLVQRITQVRQLARTQQQHYTIVFTPATGTVDVVRWIPKPGAGRSTPEALPTLSAHVLDGATIETTTLPGDTLVISDTGFPLSRGRIYLRGHDGSRDSVVIGGGE